ncbi:MAG: IS1182 family transposase [Chloroflexota bacterium]|jgi:transposase
MARYKPYPHDQIVMIPVSLQEQLEPGTLEYTIHELVEEHIDLSIFEARYQNDRTGAKAINPKILLKVILFAYARGMVTSRKIERACRENILFMALSGGFHPDHSTIAHFVSSMQIEIEPIFCNILLVCEELDLLGGTHFSLDGLKLPSNASKEWSGSFQELKHKRDKLQEKLKQQIAQHIRQDAAPSEKKRRQRQRDRLARKVERLNAFLETNEPKIGKGSKEIQSNLTDNESAKMPSSHGVIQGYNAQALVDDKHQIILHAEAFSSQDHENLAPMMKAAQKNVVEIGKRPDYFEGKTITADSNYFSHANLAFCEEQRLNAFIPDIQFRQRDPRFADQQRFRDGLHPRQRITPKAKTFSLSDFSFEDAQQAYRCPHGQLLKRGARSQLNRYRVYDIYRARPQDCADCPLRMQCLSKTTSKYRSLSVETARQKPNLIETMKQKIDSPHGRQIYARRLAIVEPVFANIRACKRLDRFTLRKKRKVDVQWKLFALVHNIGKILHYGLR